MAQYDRNFQNMMTEIKRSGCGPVFKSGVKKKKSIAENTEVNPQNILNS